VISEIADEIPPIYVDRARLPQAIATFIGHARRSAMRASMRIRASVKYPTQKPSRHPTLFKRRLRIDIEVPSSRFTAQELDAMLNPERQPGQHRGLALGLRLARSIVEHHGGRVRVTGRTVTEPAFLVELPL
jgi:signal transduction histidine kinase